MPAFNLPEFYVPWPARLNPNIDTARTHAKAWAREVGILEEGGIWSEAAFDRHDYALLCAYIHPEVPADELNLMCDWNVWAFYVDDFFLQAYKQTNDRVGAKQYLDRMLLFMPVELHPIPAPTNPMERALVNLWLRTAPAKSAAWRSRIFESTRTLLQAFLWELDSMNHKRLANPIEYIEMRRQVGAALWSADLVEHAMSVEIPERIVGTRPMQVLKNTFADGVHLRNDIFSYDREVLKEGELTNAVLVFERFLNVSTQQAADLTNDLLTSRLQQFEHTAVTELAELFQTYALDPLEQLSVMHYIRGLQDWQSGAHEWHIVTSRYLNPGNGKQNQGSLSIPGLPSAVSPGTLKLSTKRFKNYQHIPYKKVGPTRLPKFYMPYKPKVSPFLDKARKLAKAWSRQMGMFDTVPEHPDIFIWDEQSFDACDATLFNALCHPHVTAEQLYLDVHWMMWGVYADDYFAQVYGHTHNMAGAKIFYKRLFTFMPVETAYPTGTPINALERGLLDLWPRTTAGLSTDERRLYRKTNENMIGGWLWELSSRIQNRIPDLMDYVEMRHKTSGSDFIMFMSPSVQDRDVLAEVHRTLTMKQLSNAAIDYIWLTNDIFSYQKEIEHEGDINNGVLIIENFLGCQKVQAVEIANELMTARMQQFEHIVANELPVLFENFNLNTRVREQLLTFVEALQNFMCGSLVWHFKTSRYDESDFRRTPGAAMLTTRINGFGTSAAHILGKINNRINISSAATAQIAPATKTRNHATSHLSSPFSKKLNG